MSVLLYSGEKQIRDRTNVQDLYIIGCHFARTAKSALCPLRHAAHEGISL
jgi:hypothetical protein